MMPVSVGATNATDNEPEEFPEQHVDYKQKYKMLKKKLRLLVYEQECFLDELRKAQRKLLKVTRDRSFLLDRLLQHEKIDDSSDESEATNSTDTEDGHKDAGPAKRKKMSAQSEGANQSSVSSKQAAASAAGGADTGTKKKSKSTKKTSKSAKLAGSKSSAPPPKESPGQMTREELERHLDSKQMDFCIEKATPSLPMEIFSNDPNYDSGDAGGEEEEDDLVIDVPH